MIRVTYGASPCGGDARCSGGKSPRWLKARMISHATIASHKDENNSSTALPLSRPSRNRIGARKNQPSGTLESSPMLAHVSAGRSRWMNLFGRHDQRIALIGGQALRFGEAQLLAHHIGAEYQRNHLVEGMAAAHALAAHPAIGRDHQPLGRD